MHVSWDEFCGFFRQILLISHIPNETFTAVLVASSSIVVEPLESLGDSITTAVLLSWSKEIGDSVKEDEVIAIVETDKVSS